MLREACRLIGRLVVVTGGSVDAWICEEGARYEVIWTVIFAGLP